MEKRKIRNVFPALRDDIADLTTYRALPTRLVDMIDPFLFLNHHGRQTYPPGNRGLPFGPHPHRGFETVTFILEGDIAHRDSGGHESVIGAQGVQWMTAGRGLVHSEESSAEFKTHGGPLEILQLWVNLPARLKMTDPRYIGLQGDQIPVLESDAGRVRIHLISGDWDGQPGPIKPLTDITVMTIELKAAGKLALAIAPERNIFFYVIRGAVEVNGQRIEQRHLVEFDNEGEELAIEAASDAMILLCHAEPYGEPVVAHGPFVMNTREEIQQAIRDYQAGKFGG
jgi:redox-sensitive bicupin YhaK (pirin superfamily)